MPVAPASWCAHDFDFNQGAITEAELTCSMPNHREREHALPLIIQGGMGIGVSNWKLARAVSVDSSTPLPLSRSIEDA